MGQGGPFWDQVEAAFGQGNVTSGYRSQAEQDALRARGVTRARTSTHTSGNGYDLSINAAESEAEIRERLAAQGLSAARIIRETGRGRNQGTGAHWHVELDAVAGGQPTDQRAVTSPEEFLSGLQSSLGPEVAASGGVTQNAPTVMNGDAEMAQRFDNVEANLGEQGDLLSVLTSVTDAAQATQLAGMAEMVDETRVISNQITEGTEALRRQVQPVFQARGRIADQLDQLNTMNPLERGLRSIFDLNYNRGYLEEQLDNYDRTLEVRSNDFDYINKLHETAMGEIERRYSLDNAVPGLVVQQTEQDLGIVGMRLQQSAELVGSLRDRVSGETQLISARALAREDMMSRLDGPTVLGLMNDAQKANGTVSYNGVTFSYNELRDRMERDEDQELNREAHRMAIASGRMDIADKYATNIARSLTRQQAEAALANGGVHNGVQLPNDILANVYQNHVQLAQTQAETIATTLPTGMALRTGAQAVQQIIGIHNRTREMFGGAGVEGMAQYLSNGADLVRQLTQAARDNAPPEVITALTQRIAQNSASTMQALDQSLLRQSGGNAEQAGYLKSFVLGTPLDSAASIQAITYFATRGARPEGIAMSQESREVFQAAEGLVRSIRAETPNISLPQLRQRVASELGDRAARSVGQARFERINRDLPRLATAANNPFGQVNPREWQLANQTAASDATMQYAQRLETSVENVNRMRTTGQPIDTTPEAGELFRKFSENIGIYNALEQGALIREVDQLAPVEPGRRNSSLMLEFLQSPELNQQVGQYSQGVGSNSFGDYIINPMAEGAVESMVEQQAQGLTEAQLEVTRTQRQQARTLAETYGNDPEARVRTILGGIEGVGRPGAAKLMPFITEVLNQPGNRLPAERVFNQLGGNTEIRPWMVEQENRIVAALQSTKFDDPEMEAYRRTAVRGWSNVATQQQTFLQQFIDGLNPFGN